MAVRRRIETIVILNIGALTVVLLAVLGALSYFNVYNYSIQNAYELVNFAIAQTDVRLTMTFEELERLTRSLASYDEVRAANFERLDRLFYWTVHERSQVLRSVFLGTEDGRAFFRGYGSGFVNGYATLPEGYDPRTSSWYETAKRGQAFTVTDIGQLDTVSAIGIRGVLPVFDEARNLVGVLGVDMTLDKIQNIIQTIDLPNEGKGMLLSSQGGVIASQFSRAIPELTSELQRADIDELGLVLAERSGQRIVTIGGERHFAAYRRNFMTGMFILAAMPYDLSMAGAVATLRVLAGSFVAFLAILVLTVTVLIRRTLKPIRPLMSAIDLMHDGDFTARADVRSNDEIGVLAENFNEMARSIEDQNRRILEYSGELERKVHERTAELEEKNEVLVRDLAMAQRIQLAIIPHDDALPDRPEFGLAARYQAMENLGGDLYDVLRLGRNVYGFLIADVSGHGVPAALITTMAKASFQSHSRHGLSTGAILTEINDEVYRFIGDLEYYLSAFLCVLDLETGDLMYTNAGHHAGLLRKGADGSIVSLDTNGYFIGSFEDGAYETRHERLEPGDRVVLFTDGFIEARNHAGDFYEHSRFVDFVKARADLDPQAFVDALAMDVERFSGDAPQNDDRAVLVVDFKAYATSLGGEGRGAGMDPVPESEKTDSRDTAVGSFRDRYLKAIALLKAGESDAAVRALSSLKADRPEDLRVANNLGVAYYQSGQIDKAWEVFQAVLERSPSDPTALKNVSFIEKARSGFVEAD